VFMCLLIVASLLGNTLVCTLVARSQRLQTNSNFFVCSLAISDILVSVTVIPFDIVYWIYFPRWPLGGYLCNLWNALFFVFLSASVLNLLAVSADRFIAVVFALRYESFVFPRVVKYSLVAIWGYSVGIGILIFFILVPPRDEVYSFEMNPLLHGYLLVGNVLAPFILMTTFYFKIYLIARGHAKRVGMKGKSVCDLIGRELRVAKALGIVIATFVLCWLPFEVINVMILLDEGVETCAVEVADTVFCWLAYLQTALNPVVFALTNSEFRRAFCRMFSPQFHGNSSSSLNSTNKQTEQRENSARQGATNEKPDIVIARL
ncbi:predicted protein, partial [Nematostella vectensis]